VTAGGITATSAQPSDIVTNARVHELDGAVWGRVRWIMLTDGVLRQALDSVSDRDPSEELALIDRALAGINRQRDNLARSIAQTDDTETAAVLVGQLEQLTGNRRELDAERLEVMRQTERYQLARQTVVEIDEWRQRVAANLETMTWQERRHLLDLLGIQVRVWQTDHEPRWVITSDIVPAIVCSSSLSALRGARAPGTYSQGDRRNERECCSSLRWPGGISLQTPLRPECHPNQLLFLP
jgi:hypothetical protein